MDILTFLGLDYKVALLSLNIFHQYTKNQIKIRSHKKLKKRTVNHYKEIILKRANCQEINFTIKFSKS